MWQIGRFQKLADFQKALVDLNWTHTWRILRKVGGFSNVPADLDWTHTWRVLTKSAVHKQ
jgi:hypothetical protein